MPNKVFQTVVNELDFVGDILSIGITKKAVYQQGATPEDVTVNQMKLALDKHIVPSLYDFISKKKAREWRKDTMKKLRKLEGY
ncbi:MAG: hypothetical protein R6U61_08830 [Thermoplasmata archaeon]